MSHPKLKDYYKILGVAPSADALVIKKAYRGLAVKYHPDKNPENAFAEAHFKEVQEAYATLSHNGRRRVYDEERWLSGMGNRMQDKQAITPAWISDECIKLRNHIATIDTYRMNHRSLRDYIFLLLSDSHIAVLQEYDEKHINREIIAAILTSIKRLQVEYVTDVAARLETLADNDSMLIKTIHDAVSERKRQTKANKVLPVIAIIITILLCVLMYLYASRA
jgi:molecular chaperone DnaJ